MIILWIKMIRWIMFEPIVFAQEYLNIINDENNLDADTNDTQSTIDKKMDLYDDCGIINCILMYCIGVIYSIYIIYQLSYYLYILQIFIIGHFFIIIIVLLAYALILNYARSIIYNQFYCLNYYFNCLVFNCNHVFKLTLLMVILSIILSYHAIGINNNDYQYNQDSNTAIQGKIIFVCVLFDHGQQNVCINYCVRHLRLAFTTKMMNQWKELMIMVLIHLIQHLKRH